MAGSDGGWGTSRGRQSRPSTRLAAAREGIREAPAALASADQARLRWVPLPGEARPRDHEKNVRDAGAGAGPGGD